MSFLDRFRFIRNNPFDAAGYPMSIGNVNAFLSRFGGDYRSDSGEVVTPHTSMHTSTVWACVQLISSQIAINPLFMYQLDGKGNKSLAVDHDYFDLITNRPNPEQDAIQFRTAVQISILLWGNGYIELERDNAARVTAMWHRHASKTRPVRLPNGKLAYETADTHNAETRIIQSENMVHIMGCTFDGYHGLSPIEFARQTVGSKIAMDKYSGRFFANNANPSVALTIPKPVKAEDKQKMRTDWETLQTGANQHRVAILDGGMELKTISITQEQAQFLESKNASAEEIASIFGVPGHAIGLLEKSVKANVEQQAQDLLNYCLRPWMSKWEKALTCKMFNTKGRSAGRYVVKFDIKELLRPDSASRQTYYQSLIQNGVLSPNEAREIEGYNSIGPDGDGHFIQLNMQSLAQANSTDSTPDGPDTELAQEMEENSLKRVSANYRMHFDDGIERFARNKTKDVKAAHRCLWPILKSTSSTFSELTEESADKAISKFLEGVEHRAQKWNIENLRDICQDEFKRALKSFIHATNNELAERRSQKQMKVLEGALQWAGDHINE